MGVGRRVQAGDALNRASPADLRRAMEAASALMKAGILFVPMPVTSAADQAQLAEQMDQRLEQLAKQAEDSR